MAGANLPGCPFPVIGNFQFPKVKPELRTQRFVFHAVFASLLLFFLFRAAAAQQSSMSAPAAPSPVAVTPEDWSRLELDPANFALLEPAIGGEDGNDKFYRELVQLQWRAGDPVEVYIVRPKGIARPPVVLYLYGYNENLDRFKNDRYCERVTAGGYAAVGFEPALGIDRFRNRPMKQWFVSELQESLGSSVHDVQLVLNYLESRKDLDLDHAGMFGQGSGGAIAILAAATDSRLKAVDTLNPWGDWSDWLAKSSVIPEVERPGYLKPEFLDRVKPLDTGSLAAESEDPGAAPAVCHREPGRSGSNDAGDGERCRARHRIDPLHRNALQGYAGSDSTNRRRPTVRLDQSPPGGWRQRRPSQSLASAGGQARCRGGARIRPS